MLGIWNTKAAEFIGGPMVTIMFILDGLES